jgi:hypothetical protein
MRQEIRRFPFGKAATVVAEIQFAAGRFFVGRLFAQPPALKTILTL